jgi:NAD(P)-dependent dehydrogenase (short-subunit alcohol dehydrogenase family)
MKLDNRVAIVTGAASGLGKSMAERLAEQGAVVILADIAKSALDQAVVAMRAQDRSVEGFAIDVTKRRDWQELARFAADRFGRIDILVSNAGVTRSRPFLAMDDADWDVVLSVDLKGVFFGAQAVAPRMIEQKYGKIVNIASVAGTGTGAFAAAGSAAGNANYASAKAGVIQLTKTLARELSPHGINVNCVAPGYVPTAITHTSRTPAEVEEHRRVRTAAALLGRPGTPADIANAVLFFASDESSFVTAQTLCVDGGRHDRI